MEKINEFEYKAAEGKVFVHKETSQRFGSGIYLGIHDSIENYSEEDATEEDIARENGTYEPEEYIDLIENEE